MTICGAMACVYIRGRKRGERTGPQLVPDAFFERFGPDTASVSRDMRGGYHVTTYADLGREKRERQVARLQRLRASQGPVRRPLYLWVFHCPGLAGVAYFGWWTYLIGRGVSQAISGRYDYPAGISWKRVMGLFPIAPGSLDGPPLTFERWMPLFAKAFCCRRPDGRPRQHAGRIQGKALIWCEVRGDHVERIIDRAQWPARNHPS